MHYTLKKNDSHVFKDNQMLIPGTIPSEHVYKHLFPPIILVP
jgi:hypothetical protein